MVSSMLSCLRFQTPFSATFFDHLINKWSIIWLAKRKVSQSPLKKSEIGKSQQFFFPDHIFFMLKCIYSFFLMILSNKDHSDNYGIIWPWELLFKYFCLRFFTTQSAMHFSSLFLLHPKINNQSTHVRFIANGGFLYGEVDLWWGSHLHLKELDTEITCGRTGF